jgi:hypothetical protein
MFGVYAAEMPLILTAEIWYNLNLFFNEICFLVLCCPDKELLEDQQRRTDQLEAQFINI